MNTMKNSRFFLAILMMAILVPALAHGATSVFVSIPPQAYFVEKIGGDLTDVHILVMPGASPHTYEPSPKQMVALSKASAYFAIGVEFEKAWLPRLKSSNQNLQVIDTQKGIAKIPMMAHDHHEEEGHGQDADHDKDHDGDHDGDNGILDPHIWLSTTNARHIAENTCQGLIKIDPENAGTYKNNLIALLKVIDDLDQNIRHDFSQLPKKQRLFMVFHPSWGYFAKDYGLTQIPIESEGNEPSPRALAEIIEHGRELGISTVFVQPQFSTRSAEVIAAELKANVVPLDPLAGDWEQNMHRAAMALVRAIN